MDILSIGVAIHTNVFSISFSRCDKTGFAKATEAAVKCTGVFPVRHLTRASLEKLVDAGSDKKVGAAAYRG